MRIVLRERREPDAELIGLAVGGLAALVGFVWLRWLHLPVSKGVLCGTLDLPCPFCGGTRTAALLLGGQWLAAFTMNPLVVLGGAAAVLWMVYAFVTVVCAGRRVRVVNVSASEARWLRMAVVMTLAANWAYVWWSGG